MTADAGPQPASHPSSPSPPPFSQIPPAEPSGRKVILWLFVALSVATAVALLYFATQVDPEFRPRIYVALVGDLMLPVIAWQLFRWIEQHRQSGQP